MVWAAAAALVLVLTHGALALCEQGGFDPSKHLVVSARQTDAGRAHARAVLGQPAMRRVCDGLEAGGVFRCVKAWRDGLSGFALREAELIGEVRARLDAAALPGADSLALLLTEDIYYENPVGIKSRPKPKPFNCLKGGAAGAGAAAAPRQLLRAGAAAGNGSGVVTQRGASDALAYLSAWVGQERCHPYCQDSTQYRYSGTGAGVTVYVVDQAVLSTHQEFERLGGRRAVSDDRHYSGVAAGNRGVECSAWHGTHVAGLVGGNTFGVAKDVSLVSVAVQPGCNMDGLSSDLIEGLDWVLERHARVGGPAVVSMSLIVTSSGVGQVIAEQVEELIRGGVVVVAAAGNFAADACDFMPANLADVITVAAAQLDTVRGVAYASPWASTNSGECVTVWAPGAYVESASSEGGAATSVYSGTSQATPMISGLVAQYLGRNPAATPADVRAHLLRSSVTGALRTVPGNTAPNFAQVDLSL